MKRSRSITVFLDDAPGAAFAKLLDRRRLSTTGAINAMIEWLLRQDPLLQAVVFGQVEDPDVEDLAAMIVKRAKRRAKEGASVTAKS
jgi:hypothetical protein